MPSLPTSAEAEPVREAAGLLLALAFDRAPTLGTVRLVCVDGPAGSGKTTLAHTLAVGAAERGSVHLLHMDDLYEGWSGLGPEVEVRLVDGVLDPLRHGRAGRYRRYDWDLGRFAEEHVVEPVDLLVVEGVGSAAARYDDRITVLAWVEAPEEVRLQRGIARDGEALRDRWLMWMRDEAVHLDREGTRDRADVWVDGTGRKAPVVRSG